MPFTPIDPKKIAKLNGIKVFEFDGEGLLNGLIANIDGQICICVDKCMDDMKKNIVTAHELGHYKTDTIGINHPRAEDFSNKNSRETMIPESVLMDLLRDGITEYSVLAPYFGVKQKMIELRCKDLKIW